MNRLTQARMELAQARADRNLCRRQTATTSPGASPRHAAMLPSLGGGPVSVALPEDKATSRTGFLSERTTTMYKQRKQRAMQTINRLTRFQYVLQNSFVISAMALTASLRALLCALFVAVGDTDAYATLDHDGCDYLASHVLIIVCVVLAISVYCLFAMKLWGSNDNYGLSSEFFFTAAILAGPGTCVWMTLAFSPLSSPFRSPLSLCTSV